MRIIADILMITGAISVAVYCIVLAKRLSRFTDLEKGVGGAIAVLSAQVDDMTKMLTRAQKTAAGSAVKLEGTTARAEDATKRLELLIASLHDVPAAPDPVPERFEPSTPELSNETLFSSRRKSVEAAE
jgi:hypothetical protein